MSASPLRKLFWIGSPFFAPALTACGWQIHIFNFEYMAVFTWDDLVRMAGWEPDVVVVADKSRPPFVVGMEQFPCVTVFYCVDSHIHSYYPLYAQAFDVCLVSLKDHMHTFLAKKLCAEQVWWFPAFAPDISLESAAASAHTDFIWDCLFVGTVDAATNRARAEFLAALKNLVPSLHVTHGDYRNLFPQGRILLNHCAAGDLNFRVFEAMGCGGCLLTPA
ncbi:MAG: glycosyltransferase, partial [Desulfovibrionaceae bacterium]